MVQSAAKIEESESQSAAADKSEVKDQEPNVIGDHERFFAKAGELSDNLVFQ